MGRLPPCHAVLRLWLIILAGCALITFSVLSYFSYPRTSHITRLSALDTKTNTSVGGSSLQWPTHKLCGKDCVEYEMVMVSVAGGGEWGVVDDETYNDCFITPPLCNSTSLPLQHKTSTSNTLTITFQGTESTRYYLAAINRDRPAVDISYKVRIRIGFVFQLVLDVIGGLLLLWALWIYCGMRWRSAKEGKGSNPGPEGSGADDLEEWSEGRDHSVPPIQDDEVSALTNPTFVPRKSIREERSLGLMRNVGSDLAPKRFFVAPKSGGVSEGDDAVELGEVEHTAGGEFIGATLPPTD